MASRAVSVRSCGGHTTRVFDDPPDRGDTRLPRAALSDARAPAVVSRLREALDFAARAPGVLVLLRAPRALPLLPSSALPPRLPFPSALPTRFPFPSTLARLLCPPGEPPRGG